MGAGVTGQLPHYEDVVTRAVVALDEVAGVLRDLLGVAAFLLILVGLAVEWACRELGRVLLARTRR